MSKQQISKKKIDQIAADVEQRVRAGKSGGQAAPKGGNGGFVWGAVAGIAAAIAAPLLAPRLRPAVREVIKGGIASGRYLQKQAEGIQEDLQDLTAEARAELDLGKSGVEG